MDERTNNGRYAVKDVNRLAADPVFNSRFSADAELASLMNPTPEAALLDEENLQCLGMSRRIFGVDIPPATIGHYRLLTTIGNECVKAKSDWSKGFDFQLKELTEALFVLRYGAAAVTSFAAAFRWKKIIEQYRGDTANNAPITEIVLEAERKFADALTEWDAAVLRFSDKYVKIEPGCTYASEANALLEHLLRAFDGFGLLPQVHAAPEEKTPAEKKTASCGMRNLRLSFARGCVRFAHRLLRAR